MKIECDKCAAKYSIADEKVRGKTFKIRCKKCSNVIIVRDKGAAADAGDDEDADQGAPGWHLAINGETVGPLAEDDVRARYDAGEIDKDTAVWQEGFEDWIPLGDVPVFADLPDAPMGGGGYDDGYGEDDDDPFANANQEDYAAGAAAAASAAVAAAAPADPAPASPRVSALTGQRNENSVLFSLDSLQSLATSNQASPQPKASAGTNQQVGTKGLATAAPGSEGSGLIDIRALGSMVGSEQPAAAASAPPAADDAALPSFGGSGLGGLAAAPLVASVPEPAAAAAAAAPPPPQRSNAPIYILMVLLILALGGLAAYILLKPEQQPQVIVKEVPGAAPSVADKEDEEDEKKDDEEDEEDEKKDDEEGEEDEGGEDEGDSEGAEDGDEKSGSKRSSRRSGRKSSRKSSSSSKSDDPLAGFDDPKPKSSTKKPTSSKKSDVSVDCILDPSKCKKGGSSKSSSSSSSKPAADPNLPKTLTSSDIRAGVAPYKSAAKACGSKHGAPAGTKVKVKLSISGSTGTVTSASAREPHNGTPLGNCVAAAVKKAKFKKFQKSQLGAVYPFTM